MLTVNHPIYHIARITIECQSPLNIKAENNDPTIDVTIFRDALDNPTIAGTSIAGVLKKLAVAQGLCPTLFGQDSPSQEDANEGTASLVRCSFGFVHNGHNQPIKGCLQSYQERASMSTEGQDDLLLFLQEHSPVLREQTRIDEYGCAEDKGKFDVSAVPKGTRFTFELGLSAKLAGKESSFETWKILLKLLQSPLFRLGSGTHRGLGEVKVIGLTEQTFNFKESVGDIYKWIKWQESDWQTLAWPRESVTVSKNSDEAVINSTELTMPVDSLMLTLEAEDFWHIGGGVETLQPSSIKEADSKPYTETIIEWSEDNKASLKVKQLVVPATAVKGPLRHRTLFHLRCLEKDWTGESIKDHDLAPLFGIEVDHKKKQGNTGAIIINDIYYSLAEEDIPKRTKIMTHNSIDRFTGGTVDGNLFSEELLYKGTLDCQLILKSKQITKAPNNLLKAFKLSIIDLAKGRLQIGAGSSKGHGYFTMTNIETVQQKIEGLIGSQQ